MDQPERIRVTGKEGLRGTAEAAGVTEGQHPSVLVRLDSGRQVLVPTELLVTQADGSYYLPFSPGELEQMRGEGDAGAEGTTVIPVVREELDVQKRKVETGRVRISKIVREREELVDEPLLREEVRVERVPINRTVDVPVAMRQEGETMIIPLLEEVLVVEKRLLLREELHITRQRRETKNPQKVTLRTEEVKVERTGAKKED